MQHHITNSHHSTPLAVITMKESHISVGPLRLAYVTGELGSALKSQRRVGGGASGDVLMGHIVKPGASEPSKVAVKCVTDPSFLPEVMQLQLLASHPGIIGGVMPCLFNNVESIVQDAGIESLASLLNPDRTTTTQHIRWTPTTTVQHVTEIYRTLAAMHNSGVVHRDIKPGNLVLKMSDSGRRKHFVFIDFGSAVFIGDTPTLSESEHCVTTWSYRAPELVLSTNVTGMRPSWEYMFDPAQDVWALSLSMLEIVSRAHLIRSAAVGAHMREVSQVVQGLRSACNITKLWPVPDPERDLPGFVALQQKRHAWVKKALFAFNSRLKNAAKDATLGKMLDACLWGLIPEPAMRFTAEDIVRRLEKIAPAVTRHPSFEASRQKLIERAKDPAVPRKHAEPAAALPPSAPPPEKESERDERKEPEAVSPAQQTQPKKRRVSAAASNSARGRPPRPPATTGSRRGRVVHRRRRPLKTGGMMGM